MKQMYQNLFSVFIKITKQKTERIVVPFIETTTFATILVLIPRKRDQIKRESGAIPELSPQL